MFPFLLPPGLYPFRRDSLRFFILIIILTNLGSVYYFFSNSLFSAGGGSSSSASDSRADSSSSSSFSIGSQGRRSSRDVHHHQEQQPEHPQDLVGQLEQQWQGEGEEPSWRKDRFTPQRSSGKKLIHVVKDESWKWHETEFNGGGFAHCPHFT